MNLQELFYSIQNADINTRASDAPMHSVNSVTAVRYRISMLIAQYSADSSINAAAVTSRLEVIMSLREQGTFTVEKLRELL